MREIKRSAALRLFPLTVGTRKRITFSWNLTRATWTYFGSLLKKLHNYASLVGTTEGFWL